MATEVFDFDGAGERYKFLLHPLKDLASNWDVDIAKTLEDYIKKVVDENDSAVLVDQNGRRKIFNFTEAALLIHGTTLVYVKKVDYVHQLALHFFDQLREDPKEKRNKVNQPENECEGEDGAGEDDGGGNESGGEDAQQARKEKQRPKVSYSAMRSVLERLSQRQAPSFPLVPISFIPLSDFEKSDVPLFSRKNAKEQIGKKDDFRINSCHIYESVALLDIKNISLVDKFTTTKKPSSQHESLEQGMDTLNSNQTLFQLDEVVEENGQGMQTLNLDSNQTLIPFGDGDGDVDVNEIVEITMEEIVAETPEVNVPPYSHAQIIAEEPKEKTYENRMEEIRTNREPKVNEPLESNFWDHLDPQDVITDHSRPYKKTNCTMNAEKQIKARERRIERECKERGVANERSIKSYIDSQMFRRPLRKRNFVFGQFNTFLMDQAVLALNPQIYEEEKRRNDLKKKRRKEKQAMEREERARHRSSRRHTLDPVLDHPNDEDDREGEIVQQQQQKENVVRGGEEDESEDGIEQIIAEDIQAFDNSDDDDNHTNLGDLLELDDLHNSLGGIRNMYTGFQHLINTKSRGKNASRFCKLAKSTRNAYDDTFMVEYGPFNPEELPNRPSSQMNHDEIIAFHLRKYWAASEAAVSKFSERMEMWEAKMNMTLEEEQKYREFDTREYGDEVLKKFNGQIDNEFDFTQMLGSVSNGYDRPRYLLVTLILANMENVEINVVENTNPDRDYSLEMGKLAPNSQMDQINVKLLKLERHHQVFEEEQRLLTGNPTNG